MAERAHDARQDAGRAHIGVLIERLADGEAQSPQGDVIGHVGRADRAEIDGVVMPDAVPPVGRHHHAVPLVIVRAPVEMIEPERKPPLARGKRIEHLDPGSDDFLADPRGEWPRSCRFSWDGRPAPGPPRIFSSGCRQWLSFRGALAREPGIQSRVTALWIPGSREARAPE
jgi:hypothetical protein